NMNINSGVLVFGANFTSTSNGRIGDVLVAGTTSMGTGSSLRFGNIAGTVNLGNLEMNNAGVVMAFGSAGSGALNGGTNLITANRLHGSGTFTTTKVADTL